MTTSVEPRIVYMRGRDRDFTYEEYLQLCRDIDAAEDRGDEEEYERLSLMIPATPDVAKAFRDVYGKEFLLETGIDLTEADTALGKGWLDE